MACIETVALTTNAGIAGEAVYRESTCNVIYRLARYRLKES